MTDEAGATRDRWSIFHFSQSNPGGRGQGDVAALLRRVADSLDALGDVDVQDITFHSEVTEDEDDLTMTVYYHRPSEECVTGGATRPRR